MTQRYRTCSVNGNGVSIGKDNSNEHVNDKSHEYNYLRVFNPLGLLHTNYKGTIKCTI